MLTPACASADAPNAVTVAPASQVAELVAPVLNAYTAVIARDDEQTELALLRKLEPLLTSRAPEATEALVVLLGFYIGAAGGEEISCALVDRGKNTIPLLRRYAALQPQIPGVDMRNARRIPGEYSIVERRIAVEGDCQVEQ